MVLPRPLLSGAGGAEGFDKAAEYLNGPFRSPPTTEDTITMLWAWLICNKAA